MSTKVLKVKKAGIFEKTVGLIGKKTAFPLFFQTRFGIHTFFLKFPIDVVVLDNTNKVVTIKKTLKPNKLFFWNPKYKNVLELPEKTIDKEEIKISDNITLL